MAAYQWLFFNFRGRISRKAYWLAYFFINVVLGLFFRRSFNPETLELSIATPVLGVLLLLPALIGIIAIAVKRLHDFNLPGWIVAFMLVPIFFPTIALTVLVIGYLVIGLIPGTAGPNRYGDAPDVPDYGKRS